MIFDTHCHPQFPHYNQDRTEVIRRALKEGVLMICVGTDLETSKEAIKLASEHKEIWATIGLHPNDVRDDLEIGDYEALLENKKVVAIGEIGLDYYRTKEKDKRELQKKILKQFLGVAKKYGKPLVIHCRNAYEDLLEIIDEEYEPGDLSGVIHSFSGDWPTARDFISRGFFIGLNGIITFAEDYNETVINAPLDKILLETDAPFLAPKPFRGKRNEPGYVKYVAQKIAELKSIDYNAAIQKTTQNARKLFGI